MKDLKVDANWTLGMDFYAPTGVVLRFQIKDYSSDFALTGEKNRQPTRAQKIAVQSLLKHILINTVLYLSQIHWFHT